MKPQKFFLKIDAESPDGEAVKCETQVRIDCDRRVSSVVLANLLKENEDIKEMFMDAFLLVISSKNEVLAEKLTDEEFYKRAQKTDDDNVEL